MVELSPGAKKIMDHFRTEDYALGDYLPASRLSYLIDDLAEREQCVTELVAQGLVSVAPNGGIGITQEGISRNGRS
jgi:hypothetical protein